MEGKPTYQELQQKIKQLEKKCHAHNRKEKMPWDSEVEKKAILNAMSDILLFQDVNLRIRWGNQAAARCVGKTQQELVGHHCYQLWHGRSTSCTGCPVLRAIETGSHTNGTMMTPDRRWWEITGEPVRDHNGKIVGAIEIAHEITERKQVEQALLESEARYRTLVEQIPAITYTAALDEASTTLYISPQIETLLGFSQAEYKADPDTWRKQLYPEDRERVLEEVTLCHRENTPFVSEYRMVTRDGGVVWFRDEAVIVCSNTGKPLYLQGVMFDLTERKQTEEALRQVQRQGKAILDNIPDIAWLKDKESKFIAVNEAFGKSCGIKPEDLVGKTDFDIWPKDLAEKYRADDREVMQSGKRKAVEEPLADKESQIKWIETIKTPIYDEKGQVIGTTGIARDITKRKHAEKVLEHAAKRDPLTGLLNRRAFSEMLEYELARFRRNRKPFSIIIGDIDHFKPINDNHGHEAGDFVLKEIASLLAKELRDQDIISRWGGEEFLILLPETDIEGGLDVAEKLRRRIAAKQFVFNHRTLTVTMSFGVTVHQLNLSINESIKRADDCLYSAKQAGKNMVVSIHTS